jgi:hypothetical protein
MQMHQKTFLIVTVMRPQFNSSPPRQKKKIDIHFCFFGTDTQPTQKATQALKHTTLNS